MKGGAANDILESDDEDFGPGPGHYTEGYKSDFRPETKPQRLQFFGSTVERFTEPNRFKVNDEIGPGSYPQAQSAFMTQQIKAGHQKRDAMKQAKVGFGAG